MRVEKGEDGKRVEQPKKSFAKELAKVTAKPAKPTAAAAPKAQARVAAPKPQAKQSAKPEVKSHARNQSAEKFSATLADRRAHAELSRPERRRVAEKLAELLAPEPKTSHAQAHVEHGRVEAAPQVQQQNPQPQGSQSTQTASVNPSARTEALVSQLEKLMERVELLARAEGPAIQLGLSEGSASRLEVVRTGKGEVAIRLQARSGAERRALTGKAAALKSSLEERGLTVKTLTIS